MSERSLKSGDVAELSVYEVGEVVIDREKGALLGALLLAPFAVENGVDPNHPVPKMAARELLAWLKEEMGRNRGDE